MNKKVFTIMIIVAVAALCVLAVIYAPNMIESMSRLHKIPQH
jgi:hypothetical protein